MAKIYSHYLPVLLICMGVGYVSYRAFALYPLIYSVYVFVHYKINPAFFRVQFHKPYCALVAVFLVTASLSLLWAEYPAASFERFLKSGFVLATGLVPLAIIPKTLDVQRFIHAFFIAWTIIVLMFVIDHLVPGTLIYGVFHTHDNILPQMNRLSVLILLGFVFIFNKTSDQTMRLAAIGLVAPVLFLTESQTVQLAFILLCLMHGAWRIFKENVVYVFGAGVSVFTLIAPWLVQMVFLHRPDTFGMFGRKATAMMRLEIWDAVAGKIMHAPLTGFGLENIRHTVLDMQHLYAPYKSVLHPHNYALQIWAETGLIGVIAFLSVFWFGLIKLRTLMPADIKTALSLMIVVWVVNMSAYGLWQSWWMGITILTIIVFYRVSDGLRTKQEVAQ